MMKKKLGMIDSGLGGIMVLNACENSYPNYDYVFIGDQLHAPYGERSVAHILEYASQMVNYLKQQGVQDVIIACNTICANALPQLKEQFPDMTLYGIIDATVKEVPLSQTHNVLVLATPKTVASHAYQDAIHRYNPESNVYEVGASKLVPLIENNGSKEAIKEALETYLLPYKNKVDAVILGCTHYPIIKDIIASMIQVPVYDSNMAVVKMIPFEKDTYLGSIQVYTTKDKDIMRKQIQSVIQKDYDVKELTLPL